MAKQLNVNLAMTADTSKAKAELQSLQKQLNDLMLSAQKNDSSLGLSKDIQKATQMAAQLKVQLEAATGSTGKLDLTKFNDQLRKSKTSIADYQRALTSLGPAGTQAFSNLASSIMQAEVPLRRANKALDEFTTSLANTARWQLSSSLLHGFMGAIQGAYRYAQDLNESLNNIRIVTGQSVDQMSRFAIEANKAAKELSTTTTAYTDAALIYYQQGLSDKEVKARTDATIKMANVSRQSAQEVSSQMTAIWNNFAKGGENLEYYADVITKLGAATAASSDEIAQGLQKFAAVADTVGLSYEKATAALATVVAETRQSADVVGTAFKTMFARFQGLQLGETLEDGVGLNKYSAALAKVGVQILDSNGELKQMDIILDDIAGRWNNISNAQQVALAETVAGTRQYAQFMAIMNNYDKILANQKLGASAGGTLNQQAEIYAESWEAAEKRVKAAAQGIYDDLIDDKFFINILNGFEKTLSFIDRLIKNMGGLKGLLVTISGLVTTIFNKQIMNAANTFIQDIRSMTPTGRQEVTNRREEAIQGLYNIADSQKNEIVGTAMKSAYQGQADLSNILLKNAEHMTEEQKKQAALLIDINKELGQEVIKTAQIAKSSELNLKSLANQQIRESQMTTGKNRPKGSIKDRDSKQYAEAIEDVKTLQTEIIENTKLTEKWRSVSQELNVITENIPEHMDKSQEQTQTMISTMKTFLSTAKTDYANLFSDEQLEAMDEALKLCDKDLANLTDEEINQLIEAFKILQQQANNSAEKIDKDVNQAVIKLGQNYTRIGNADGAKAAQEFTKAARDNAAAVQNAADATNNYKKQTDGTADNLRRLGQETYKSGQLFAGMTSAIMSVTSAINALKSLGNIWSDEDLSTGEKLLQTMTTLIPLMNSYQGVKQLQNAINLKLAASNTAVAVSEHAVAEGEAAAAAGAKAMQMSMWQIYLIIAAIIGIVWLCVKAFEAWKASTPEGKLKAAKEATEEATKAAEDATTAYDNLKSTIENYKSAKDRIKDLEEGTDDFKEAIEEANEEARKLIQLYGALPFTVDQNGMITFSDEDLNNAKSNYFNRMQMANNNQTSAYINQFKADSDVLKQNIEKTLKSSVAKERENQGSGGSFGLSISSAQISYDEFTDLLNKVGIFTEENRNQIAQELFNTTENLNDAQNELLNTLIKSNDQLIEWNNQIKANSGNQDAYAKSQIASNLLYNEDYMKSNNKEALLYQTTSKYSNFQESVKNEVANKTIDEIIQAYASQMGYQFTGNKDGKRIFKQGNNEYELDDDTIRNNYITNRAIAETGNSLTSALVKQIDDVINSAGRGSSIISAVLSGQSSANIGYSTYKKGFDYDSKQMQALGYSDKQVKAVEQNSKDLFVEQINKALSKIDGGPAGARAGQQFMKFFESTAEELSDTETDNLFNQIINTDWSNAESIQELKNTLEELGIDLENVNWDNFVKGMQQAVGYIDDFSGLEEEIKNVLTILNGLEFGKSIKEEDYKTLIAYNDAWASLFQLTTDGYRFLGDTKTIVGEATNLVSEKTKQLQADAALQNRTKGNASSYLNQKTASDYANLARSDEGFQALLQRFGYDIQDVLLQTIDLDQLKQVLTDFFNTDFAENIDNIKSYIASTATSFVDLNQMYKDGVIDQQQYNEQTKILSKTLKDEQEAAIENAKSFEELDKILEKIEAEDMHFDEIKLQEKTKEIAESVLDGAKSLEEFDQALAELAKHGVKFTEAALGEYLIKLGSQFDNCANQVLKYKNALKSGDAEQIASTKDILRASIAVNDLAKKYNLDAKTLDAHARAIKKNNDKMELSSEQAVELAARNERMNKGLKSLNSNFEEWSKTLKEALPTSMDYVATFAQMEDAIGDLIGATEDFELPPGFLNVPGNLDLIKQAAEGSQHAINELGVSITSQNLSSFFDTIKDQFGSTDAEIEAFKRQLMSIPEAIQNNLTALENGKTLSEIMGKDLEGGVEALNKFIIAAGYTKEEVNALLSGIGATADIKMVTIEQETEVPVYETRFEPLTETISLTTVKPSARFIQGDNGEQISLPDVTTTLPMTAGYRSTTRQVDVEKMTGFTQVPQIAVNGKAGPPSVSFVGVGGGSTAGGISKSSLPGAKSSGGSKGGGGGSSPTKTVKQHAESDTSPYQGIEKQISRLNSQYNKLERARKRAYGEGALNIIKQEIEKTKELANAQREYIKVIAGNQGLNFAKIIEQGGDLGAAIKAAGGGGGQLGKAYQTLLHGEKGAIHITSKDEKGNQIEVTKDFAGINMDIQISSTGVIENYDEIEKNILAKYNAEVDRWNNELTPEEQQDQKNIDRLAIAEQEKNIALSQLKMTQDSLDALWDQSDKLAEIRDGLYDLNYSLLSEKIHLKVDIAERQLKFLQYQIKILGDNIYKIPEAMNKLFGGGDSVYGKLQNLANTWKDAFYEAQSLYGLDPEQGGISAADYADMIKQAQDGLYGVIDQLLDMNEQMRNYYKKALQGVLDEMQAITSQMEHQVSIVEHLRNILSLLGRETDWTAMEGLIQGQMHMQHNNYQVSRAEAAMLKGEVQHAYANLASIQASGASEDAIYEFKRAVLQPAIDAAIKAEEQMYADLESFLKSINDLFTMYLDKAIDKYHKSMVGLYGTIDYLKDSMTRAAAIAEDYLTTTNKLYETNELLRKIGQDMDKSDSAYAKRKLKNFADEIQQLQNRRLLQKSDLELAKARYELLQAEIALTEAQNAKSTVRLQRDNEGNYGYIYTADRDAIDNAEADFAKKQNDLYNIALEQANNAMTALVQLDQEYTANLRKLAEDRANGLIQTEEEYQFKVEELTKQYNDRREALIHTYNTALVVLNETGAEGSTEAWVTHYSTVLTSAQDNHAQITNLIYDLNSTLQWLNQERAAITAEAQLDTQSMIATVGQLTAENDKLAAEMTGTVIPKAQALLSTVNDLTAAWAKQYDQIMKLIQEYMNLIAVMQQALEALATEQNQNQQAQDAFDYSKDYSLEMFKTFNDKEAYLQAMKDREKKISDLQMQEGEYIFGTSTTAAIISKIYEKGMVDWFINNMNSSFKNIQTGIQQGWDDSFLRELKQLIPGYATGGYTGEWGDNGKLAVLHQKELVLNEADTANLLASVKIIRSIADAIGLRASAANTESSIAPGFIPGQGALEQTVTIHAEFPNAINHNEIEEAFANLVNRATQYAGRISANADRE